MEIPNEVCLAYGVAPRSPRLVPSLINRTFIATQKGGGLLVMQRLHPSFGPDVNLDLEAITQHLLHEGFETPTLVRTQGGEPWVKDAAEQIWRGLTFVEGRVISAIEHQAQAHSAGSLLGSFHRSVASLKYEFRHIRAGAHDTAKHLERLAQVQRQAEQRNDHEVVALTRAILKASQDIRVDYSALPRRITHGDLKISNILFWGDRPREARCLIDLDTLGYQHMAYELGDALRSWCNPKGENQAAADVDIGIFQSALNGYASTAGDLLSPQEVVSVVEGLQTISLELAARFAIDALEDRYFGWDEQRFATRREHNLLRAAGQLGLFGEASRKGGVLLRIAREAFAISGG